MTPTNTTAEYTIGQNVECVEEIMTGKLNVHVNNGVVERLTPTLVVVRNEHGNVCKYYRESGKCVGYSWPHCTYQIR
jgi:hypothetical protein